MGLGVTALGRASGRGQSQAFAAHVHRFNILQGHQSASRMDSSAEALGGSRLVTRMALLQAASTPINLALLRAA